jgi:hypothetical protein
MSAFRSIPRSSCSRPANFDSTSATGATVSPHEEGGLAGTRKPFRTALAPVLALNAKSYWASVSSRVSSWPLKGIRTFRRPRMKAFESLWWRSTK